MNFYRKLFFLIFLIWQNLSAQNCLNYLAKPATFTSASITATNGNMSQILDGEGATGNISDGNGGNPHFYWMTNQNPVTFYIRMNTSSTINLIKFYGPWGFDEGVKDVIVRLYSNSTLLGTENIVLPPNYNSTIGRVISDLSTTYSNVTNVELVVVSDYGINTYLRTSLTEVVFGEKVVNTPPPVQNVTNACPTTTVNLNLAHTGVTPQDSNLRWFKNNAHTGTYLTSNQIENATAGTYYAFYYNDLTACYSPPSNPVTVNINVCPPLCDSDMFLSQSNQLYRIITSTNPFTYIPVGSTYTEDYNALGFNPLDGYLYAIAQTTYNLIKINPSTGSIVALGKLINANNNNVINTKFINGEFDENGFFYLKSNSSNEMFKVNISTRLATPIIFSPAGNYQSSDFAYNKKDGLLYAVMTISGQGNQLYTINPVNGNITNVGSPHLPGFAFGAIMADNEGRIFGSSNGGGFYQFDKTTGEKTLISTSPISSQNDGAHCINSPISFGADPYIIKTDNTNYYTPGKPSVYTIEVGNNGPFGIMEVGVLDPLPSGIPASNVNYITTVSGGATTKVIGTSTGAINDKVNLPLGGKVTYTVTINVPENFTGSLINTASLEISNTSSYDINLNNNIGTDTNVIIPFCTKPGDFTLTGSPTNVGITTQLKQSNWPEIIPNGFIALESKEKGMVISRVQNSNMIKEVKEGMLIYDIDAQCVKLYNGLIWNCIKRSCNY